MADTIELRRIPEMTKAYKIIFPKGFAQWINGKTVKHVKFTCESGSSSEIRRAYTCSSAEEKISPIATIFFNPAKNLPACCDKFDVFSSVKHETFSVPTEVHDQFASVLEEALAMWNSRDSVTKTATALKTDDVIVIT